MSRMHDSARTLINPFVLVNRIENLRIGMQGLCTKAQIRKQCLIKKVLVNKQAVNAKSLNPVKESVQLRNYLSAKDSSSERVIPRSNAKRAIPLLSISLLRAPRPLL